MNGSRIFKFYRLNTGMVAISIAKFLGELKTQHWYGSYFSWFWMNLRKLKNLQPKESKESSKGSRESKTTKEKS